MFPGQQQNDAHAGAIRPTLFLALGGTGKEVLLRLRRKFYERLGVPGLPCTAYLWLDTDTRDCMAVGEKIDDIYNAVAFSPQEKLPLLAGSVKDDLAQVMTNTEHWRHVHKWLYPEVARYGTQIADGAGGVRAVGRLTYFHHFAEINNRLNNMIDALSQHESINGTRDFFLKRNMGEPEFPEDAVAQVVLVSSLAGGTGCGTFLDAAFHLAHMVQADRKPIERVIGILFMPNIYYGGATTDEVAQRSYGNAYAALKELEFFTVRRGDPGVDAAADFPVEWERDLPLKVQGPPFAISYIQEMKNEAGLMLNQNNRAEVFNMVAEALFLDFMPGAFSTAKRSHYSNVAQFLAGQAGTNISFENVSLPQAFARRYASFGMAKIEIPMDQLKAACAAQLAYEIASYIKRPFSDPNIHDTTRADQIACALDKDRLPARFGEEWKAMIRAGVAKPMPKGTLDRLDQVPPLEAALTAAETELVFAEGAAPEKWGRAVSFLREKTKDVIAAVENDVHQWVRKTLGDPSRGLGSLVETSGYAYFLEQYVKELYVAARDGGPSIFDSQIASARGDADSQRKRKQHLLLELKTAIPSISLVLLASRRPAVDLLLERLRAAEEQYCLARAEEVLLEQSKIVAQAAVACIERELTGYKEAYQKLDGIAQACKKKKAEFLNVTEQVLFIRFFNEDKDWERCYRLGGGTGRESKVDVRAEYELFLAYPPPGAKRGLGGVWELLDLLNRRGEKEVYALLQAYCDSRFWADFEAHPRDVDVLKHPSMTDNWSGNIDRLVRSAMPLARRDRSIAGQNLQVRRVAYLGLAVKPDDDPKYKEFADEVTKRLTARLLIEKVEPAVTNKPWEVYLYIVAYAFPTPALPITRECQRAYSDVYRAIIDQQIGKEHFHIPLHLSKGWEGKFEELAVYDDESARRAKGAREVLLFAPLLKVLRCAVEQGRKDYSYTSGAPLWKPRQLGARRDAEDALARDVDLRAALLRAVAAREAALEPDQLLAYYWMLQYLAADDDRMARDAESVMLEKRMEEILARKVFADPAGPAFAGLANGARRDQARAAGGALVEWGAVPVLAGLADWFPPSPADR
jgi:hypothetical protein